jgi:hypothetical protein
VRFQRTADQAGKAVQQNLLSLAQVRRLVPAQDDGVDCGSEGPDHGVGERCRIERHDTRQPCSQAWDLCRGNHSKGMRGGARGTEAHNAPSTATK